MRKPFFILLIILSCVSVLTGCKTGKGSTATSTLENPASVVPTGGITGAGYPAPAGNPGSSYPAPPGSVVAENASRMTVEILSLSPAANDPQYVIAHVKVKTSAAVEGKTEYNPNLPGQETDIHLLAADATNLAVGNILILTVSYRMDDAGGGYYGSEISKQ
jgi:hypothetical protein